MFNLIIKYGLGEVIAKGLNISLILLLPAILPSDDFSQIVLILALEQILFSFILFGQNTTFIRWYQRSTNKHSLIIDICNNILLYSLMSLCLIFITLYLCGLDSIIGETELIFLIAACFFLSKNELNYVYLRVVENHSKYFKAKVLFQLLKFILCIAFIQFGLTAESYIYSILVASIIIYFSFKQPNSNNHYNIFKPNKTFKLLFIFSIPIAIQTVLNVAYTFTDRVIIDKFLSSEELAIYGNSYNLGSLVFFGINVLSLVLLPKFYKSKKESDTSESIINLFTTISIIGIFIYCVILGTYFNFFTYFYDAMYEKGKLTAVMISSSFIFHVLYLRYFYKLNLLGFIRYLPYISFVSLAINVFLNIIFIPKWGIEGAASATLISELVFSLLTLFYYRTKMKKQ
jgi:O-antigen/teichoic acid export membrane protein